jgi:glutathione synthase
MHTGGKAEKAEVTEHALRLAELVRPKLIRDGMFLVGLDIAGDKLMEINVFSPGGLYSCCTTQGERFGVTVIEAVARKIEYKRLNPIPFRNCELATL